MVKKKTKEEFVSEANRVHNNKYNYDKFVYTRAIDKGIITCPIHGDFKQSPNTHLRGHGCHKCHIDSVTNVHKVGKIDYDYFIKKASEIHNNKYIYPLQNITSSKQKVKIICPKHGEFIQSAALHMTGQGCSECGNESKRAKMASNAEEFIGKARKVHGDKYDYSKVEYINEATKVCIICPEHGEFWQRPLDHLFGKGCPKCNGKGKTKDDFVKEAIEIHGDRYNYDKVDYQASEIKVAITCNKCRNTFYQKPWVHLQGHGCPYCKQSKLEWEIKQFLDDNNLKYEIQYRPKWLNPKSIDFFLPDFNLAIECQGEQHFKGSREFGHDGLTEEIIKRDIDKNNLCKELGIDVIYYTNAKNAITENYIGEIFTDKSLLLERINKQKNSIC